MDALLTTIVLWLSINFGLPATADLPKVEFARPIEITFFRYQAFTAEAQRQVLANQAADPATNGKREVVAVYDARRNRILLPQGWSGQIDEHCTVVERFRRHKPPVIETDRAGPVRNRTPCTLRLRLVQVPDGAFVFISHEQPTPSGT